MLFNTLEFAIFFLLVLTGYSLLWNHWTARKVLLLAASYVFYMAWNPPFGLLLAGSTLLDYEAGRRIAATDSARNRKVWVLASIVGNLGVLGFFKYADFLLANVWFVVPSTVEYPTFLQSIVLPLGISFYTFQSMSYTIDVYRKQQATADSFLDFALYVSFFPQLVAGPIVRAGEFLPQLKENPRPTSNDVSVGVDLIFRGLAKKVLIADTLGEYVDMVFAAPEHFGAVNQLVAIYAYAFQLYLDFSGYSDMAVGMGRLMGFRLPINFRSPYLQESPPKVWQRWHITLTTWLRDYVYTPMSMRSIRSPSVRKNPKALNRALYMNTIIFMIVLGIWHGAAWNFVVFGMFHGFWLVAHRVLSMDLKWPKPPKLVGVICTFHIWCLGLVTFRAQSLGDIATIYRNLFDFSTPVYQVSPWIFLLLVVSFLSHVAGASERLKALWEGAFFDVKVAVYSGAVVAMFFFASTTDRFIYFQF